MYLLQYLWYVLKHKWFVLIACMKLGEPILGITHDLSKFRPSELVAYARYFYGPYSAEVQMAMDRAWLLHQKRNPHHWQYWLLKQDDGSLIPVPIPDRYIREMIADWVGAGKAQGNNDIVSWYWANRDKMSIHPDSKLYAEILIEDLTGREVSC